MPDLSFFLPRQFLNLIWQFARRDVLGRYRGSLLGVGWSVLTPLVMLLVYTFVFVGVFKARWPGSQSAGGFEFALQMYAGLILFNFFAETVGRAPRLILEQPNLVSKVVFPLQILPWVTVVAGGFHLVLNAVILLVATGIFHGGLPLSALTLPVVWLPMLPMLLGLGWLLSSLGVYIRDIGQMIGMAISLLMFMSPIFYSTAHLSPRMQFWMHLNPLTLLIEQTRAVLLNGQWPDWGALGLHFAVMSVVALIGGLCFAALRKGFADVL